MARSNQAGVAEPVAPPSTAATSTEWPELAYRELVSRVVSSPAFARSERLSTLLTYICEMSLKGRNGDLNEQRIGHAVFGRARDYDSSVDGIVRTQASRLRQRLDLHFAHEGAAEPVRILIPKGGYVPIFTPQQQEQKPDPEKIPPTVPSPITPLLAGGSRALKVLPWLFCVALALSLAGVIAHQAPRDVAGLSSASAQRHPLWSQILAPHQSTLVVPADSGLVLSHAFNQSSVSLQQYLAGDYRRGASEPGTSFERKLHSDIASRRYTSVVDLEAAVWLAQRSERTDSGLQVRYARDLRPNDLKSGNVVLLGAFESNPWMELFERNMNFLLRNAYQTGIFSVINKSPRAGEPAVWQSKADDPQRRTSMAGTEAAWDFVSDDSELLPFLKRIQTPDGRVPHFELLLGTQNMSSSAVHSNLLAWRVAD